MFKKDYLFVSLALLLIGCLAIGITVGNLIKTSELPYVLVCIILIATGYLFKHLLFFKVLLLLSSIALVMLIFENVYFLIAILALFLAVVLLVKSVMAHTKQRTQQITVINNSQQKHAQITQDTWLDPRVSRNESYAFEDMHDTSLIGDTVINLTQTILPENNPFIVLHKGFGDIRILVPLGVGVLLSTHTLYGNVFFENEDYALKNAKLTMYSSNYATATQKIKIVTTVYIGNVEVVYI